MSRRSNHSAARRLLAPILGVLVIASMWLALNAGAQEKEQHRNLGAQKLKNPVPPDDESIEAGKKIYQRRCASCHGPTGKGDGGMALSGGTPSDLTDETWDYGSTDGEMSTSATVSQRTCWRTKISSKKKRSGRLSPSCAVWGRSRRNEVTRSSRG